MSEKEQGTEHRATITGTEKEASPATEHRDVARGNAEERNELTPEQRGRGDGYGPRTHDDTKITRKEG